MMFEKIKEYCDSVGISVSQFERICGVSQGYANKLKYSEPGVRTARRMCQVMGITIEELLDEQDRNTEEP